MWWKGSSHSWSNDQKQLWVTANVRSGVADFHTERLLRFLLRVVHVDQDLHGTRTLAGGEPQSDGVTLRPAELSAANTHTLVQLGC